MAETHEMLRPDEISDDVRSFWRETAARQDRINVLTRSPEWFEMMADGRDGSLVSVFSGKDGEPRAVLPLIPVRAPWGGDILKAVGGELFLAVDCSDTELSVWLSMLYASPKVSSSIFFDHLPLDQAGRIKRASRGSAFRVDTERNSMIHHRLVLPDERAGLEKLHSSRAAQKIRASERKLREVLGSIRLLDIRSVSDIEPLSDQIEVMMAQTWQAADLGRSFSVKDLRSVAERGWLRCFALHGNQRVVAFAACYQGMGTLVYEIIGYDQQYAQYSPGKVLLNLLLARLYEEDKPEFVDYGEGFAAYKSGGSNDSVLVSRTFLSGRGLIKSSAVRWHCLKQSLRNGAFEMRKRASR